MKQSKDKYLNSVIKQSPNRRKNKIPIYAFVESLEMQCLREKAMVSRIKSSENASKLSAIDEGYVKGFSQAVEIIKEHFDEVLKDSI